MPEELEVSPTLVNIVLFLARSSAGIVGLIRVHDGLVDVLDLAF
jgi:hypothetical protein